MSTVLTNGIIIPDNGSRNWGGDLANNWNIIDLNVGYMTDVKNRVTTLENSVAENSSNIEINTSNISALQTSKQDTIEDLETIRSGASAGATAVQPSALNNYVDLSSGQTISGAKTFTSMLTCSATVALLGTSTDKYLAIQSGNTWDNGARISLYSKEHTENSGQFEIVAFNNENKANIFKFTTDGVIPISVGSTLNLGTSTNKWKTLNGINPGALSLPDPSPAVFISKSLPASGGTITADADGWLEIRTKATSPNALIQIFVAGGNATYAKNTGDTLIISVPMKGSVSATIFYKDIETPTVCRLVPCLGNV